MKKSKMFLLGMAALAFVLVLAGCKTDDDPEVPKSITITGITGSTVLLALFDTPFGDYLVNGNGTIVDGSVTVALKNTDNTDWTGSGSFYVGFWVDDSTDYGYTNGSPLVNASSFVRVGITSANTTIAFSGFKQVP
jgi:hypothetical protein